MPESRLTTAASASMQQPVEFDLKWAQWSWPPASSLMSPATANLATASSRRWSPCPNWSDCSSDRRPDERELEWNGRPVRSMALIHCVGSRQIEGVHAAAAGRQGQRLLLAGVLHGHPGRGQPSARALPAGQRLRRLPGYPHLRPRARGLLHARLQEPGDLPALSRRGGPEVVQRRAGRRASPVGAE